MIRLALLLWVLLEVAAFALAGRLLGVLGTLALVLLTAVAGGMLLRAQGAGALASLRGGVRRGGDPLRLLLRDGFRLVAALLLILPGLLGDVAGLLLLVPWVQGRVAADLARRGRGTANLGRAPRGAPRGASWSASWGAAGTKPARPPSRPEVVEAEWEEVAPPAPPRPGPSQDRARPPSGWTRG